jgi:hypothetical protein
VTYNGDHVSPEQWREEVLPCIFEKVGALASKVSVELVERFPRKELLEAMSILQASYGKPNVILKADFKESVEYLANFYGKSKCLLGVRERRVSYMLMERGVSVCAPRRTLSNQTLPFFMQDLFQQRTDQ